MPPRSPPQRLRPPGHLPPGLLRRGWLNVHQTGPGLHLTGQKGKVLAQRVALELAGQVQMAQAR
ncbi:MAG: hypothetical protein M3404_10130, partial [Actinomycetota bacterium]|nr:hypothetical protein [Actinomycetota bacterium]